MKAWPAWVACLALATGCAHAPRVGSAKDRFKMVHQVAVSHDGKEFVLTGYMLGRADGSFRVTAAVMMGPRVFDVARVNGEWKAKIQYAPLAEKLDPRHLGRAIARVYFTRCPGEEQRCAVQDDDELDRLEVDRDAQGRVTRKQFFKGEVPALTIAYEDFQPEPDGWQAGLITLTHGESNLRIALDEYVPGFEFDDALLTP